MTPVLLPPPVSALRSVTITIPGRPPTPNARRHWRAIAKDNEAWKADAQRIAASTLAALPDGWVPLGAAELEIVFVVPDRRARDLDNLIASTKPLTDGLVAAGVLTDDSIAVLGTIRYGWRHEPRVDATEYLVREVAP